MLSEEYIQLLRELGQILKRDNYADISLFCSSQDERRRENMFLLYDELIYQQDSPPIQREVKHNSFSIEKKARSLIRISKNFYSVDLASL